MLNIVINGVSGKMGAALLETARELPDVRIVGGVDAVKKEGLPCPFYTELEKVTGKADCIIDFSRPAALPSMLNYAVRNNVPVVLCTTGYDAAQLQEIETAAKKIPILKSGNMSLGVNVVCELIKKAAAALSGFDIEITETHHNQKQDAPSGTALMMADAANAGLKDKKKLVYGRSPESGKRGADELGMHSLRGGTVVGEHEISFFGPDEVVTVKHSAFSRKIFAAGAFHAARFLIGKKAGLYGMGDVIK
ncbi:4-hydroxy-tetrahydrodipicolinate reductase [Clostridia bacterium]|nr:4-hydroxy-tetrahydrodipicolinate reductase [Clostridia bacterium]